VLLKQDSEAVDCADELERFANLAYSFSPVLLPFMFWFLSLSSSVCTLFIVALLFCTMCVYLNFFHLLIISPSICSQNCHLNVHPKMFQLIIKLLSDRERSVLY